MSEQQNNDFKVQEFPWASLYIQTPGKDRERSSCMWSSLNKNPRLTIWTRIDDEEIVNGKKKGPIQVGFGHAVILDVLDEAEKFFLSDDIDILAWDNKVSAKSETEQTGYEKVIGTTLIMGRQEDGMCFMGLKSADKTRPELTFYFRGFDWHEPRRKNTPVTDAEKSKRHAIATVRYLRTAFSNLMDGQTPEERRAQADARKARREGGGGGYRKPQNSQPKPQMTSTGGFDEDFQF